MWGIQNTAAHRQHLWRTGEREREDFLPAWGLWGFLIPPTPTTPHSSLLNYTGEHSEYIQYPTWRGSRLSFKYYLLSLLELRTPIYLYHYCNKKNKRNINWVIFYKTYYYFKFLLNPLIVIFALVSKCYHLLSTNTQHNTSTAAVIRSLPTTEHQLIYPLGPNPCPCAIL